MNPTTSADALTQLQQIQSQSQDPNAILANQRQQLGVQNAQDTVTGLRGAINSTTKLLSQVAPSVMGRTGNSLVTNAQATKQISNEQAPINQTLTDQGTQLTQDQQDLTDLQNQAQTAATGVYQGQQDKLSYAQNLYNTLYQKEKDAQAEADAQAAQAEQTREYNETLAANKAASAAASFSPTLGGGNNSTSKAAPATDPIQQAAYNDVNSRVQAVINGQHSDQWLKNDYAATQNSANRGNKQDQAKLILYAQLRPDLFGKSISASVLGNGSQLRF